MDLNEYYIRLRRCKGEISACLAEAKKLEKSFNTELLKAPKGHIRCISRRNAEEYYLVTEKYPKQGKYVQKKYRSVMKNYAKKAYMAEASEMIGKSNRSLEKALHVLETDFQEKIENSIGAGITELLEDKLLSDEEYIKAWESVEYEGLAFDVNDKSEFYTDKGERVRSKSEINIANALKAAGIPYRYEYPIKLGRLGTVYPDFCILDVKNRRIIIWEHLGKMGSDSYREKNIKKVNEYMSNGYLPCDNLIITMEDSSIPLSMLAVNKIIDMIK